jgi:hypothetical protein
MNKKMLKIQNINKIWGKFVDSKWLPNSKGWVVRSVESVGDTYIFELASNGKFKQAEIQLRREPFWFDGEIKYELWAWNMETLKPEVLWRTKEDLKTIRDMCLWLGYMIDKIVPKTN